MSTTKKQLAEYAIRDIKHAIQDSVYDRSVYDDSIGNSVVVYINVRLYERLLAIYMSHDSIKR